MQRKGHFCSPAQQLLYANFSSHCDCPTEKETLHTLSHAHTMVGITPFGTKVWQVRQWCPPLCVCSQHKAGSCCLHHSTYSRWVLGVWFGKGGSELDWACLCTPLASLLGLCSRMASAVFQKTGLEMYQAMPQTELPAALDECLQCYLPRWARITSTYLL